MADSYYAAPSTVDMKTQASGFTDPTFSFQSPSRDDLRLMTAVDDDQPVEEAAPLPRSRKSDRKKPNTGTSSLGLKRLAEVTPWKMDTKLRLMKKAAFSLQTPEFDPKVQKKLGALEVVATTIFIALLVTSILLAQVLFAQDQLPVDLPILQAGNTLEGQLVEGEHTYYSVSLEANTIHAIVLSSNNATLDTTLGLLQRPNSLLAFNDDVSTDNKLSTLIYSRPDVDANLVVDVSLFREQLSGAFNITLTKIKQLIQVNELIEVSLASQEVFFLAAELSANTTYSVYAFNGIREVDTVIRIRSKTGEEIIEAFQGTITEFTARVLFTPDATDTYVLEFRSIFRGTDFNVLLTQAEIQTKPISEVRASQASIQQKWQGNILDTTPSVLEIDLEGNVIYEFDFNITYNVSDKTQISTFFFNGFESTVGAAFGIWQGISTRLYDKAANRIVHRARTDYGVEFVSKLAPNSEGVEVFLFDITGGATKFQFVPERTMSILLEVGRMNPSYGVEDDRFLDTPLGAYDLTVRQVGTVGQETIQSQSDLVDQRNLYESCSVDQQKQTIDGGCETGILLFCRNEFHPFMNTSLAKKDTFSNICECVDVLCAGLPSGENIGSGFDKLLQMTYALFAVLSIGAILVFTIVMVDLFREGDFHDWTKRGFLTWSLNTAFFASGLVFFSTQLLLTEQISVMQKISEQFILDRVPIVDDSVTYGYYDTVMTDMVVEALEDQFGDSFTETFPTFTAPENESLTNDFFLNEEALNEIPNGLTYPWLKGLTLFQLLARTVFHATSVICFLDVSIVWLEASRVAGLNRQTRAKQSRRFKRIIRVLEALFVIYSVGFVTGLALTNASNYNNSFTILIAIISALLAILFFIGRLRLRSLLAKAVTKMSVNQASSRYSAMIRNTSTVVILSNIGASVGLIYISIVVKSMEELVLSRNDPATSGIFLFEETCLLCGQMGISFYLLSLYRSYRKSMYTRGTKSVDSDIDEEEGIDSIPTHDSRVPSAREVLFQTKFKAPVPMKSITRKPSGIGRAFVNNAQQNESIDESYAITEYI